MTILTVAICLAKSRLVFRRRAAASVRHELDGGSAINNFMNLTERSAATLFIVDHDRLIADFRQK